MSQELIYLFGSVVILLILIAVQGASGVLANGLKWGFSPRDVAAKDGVISGRANRTLTNHIEGLILFGFAILIIEAAGLNSSLTALGGALYFWARLVYAPVYLLGGLGRQPDRYPDRALCYRYGNLLATCYLRNPDQDSRRGRPLPLVWAATM